jgi:tRNA-2-methylthio-N6-dimethylallyladenosine synthase
LVICILTERPGTLAEERWMMMLLKKQKPDACKNCRLTTKHAWSRSEEFIGQTVEVLVEKVSKNQPKNFQEEILKA